MWNEYIFYKTLNNEIFDRKMKMFYEKNCRFSQDVF